MDNNKQTYQDWFHFHGLPYDQAEELANLISSLSLEEQAELIAAFIGEPALIKEAYENYLLKNLAVSLNDKKALDGIMQNAKE